MKRSWLTIGVGSYDGDGVGQACCSGGMTKEIKRLVALSAELRSMVENI